MVRRNELDALRGVFLLLMAGTHLPTAVNAAANQPLGFASAAEGFVFLAAFLELVRIAADSVQPDDGCAGTRGRFDLECLERRLAQATRSR